MTPMFYPPLSHITGSTSEQPLIDRLRRDVLMTGGFTDTQAIDAPDRIPMGSTTCWTLTSAACATSHIERPGA